MVEIRRIFDLLSHMKEAFPQKEDVLACKKNNEWIKYSVDDYDRYVNTVAAALLSYGVKKGDNVATIINNRPEWNFLDFALMKIGAVQVPIYPNISEENYKYIFEEAKVVLAFVNDEEIYSKISSFAKDLPYVRDVISIDFVPNLTPWDEFIQKGEAHKDEFDIEKMAEDITTDDLATIIFTSGTTGFPKGVMLSHKNFIFNFMYCVYIIRNERLGKALSFLPLCHVYERMLNYMYQYKEMGIYYAESIETVGENMREVSPTMFCAVPRVLEKTYDKIIAKGRELIGISKGIFFWAVSVGEQYDHFSSSPWYRFKLRIAKALVFRKWMEALGGDVNIIVSGGAPLQEKIARVFWAVGIQVMEGYGLTEMAPLIGVSRFEKGGVMIGTVGPVVDGVDVKFAEDGEILAKGPNVMMGYYNHPDVTAGVMDDEGYFHTGDIGEIVNGKFLKITDRKKEIFKTSGGKYVAPQPVENKFKGSSFIENVMLVGDNRNYVAAIIIPEFNHLESWCRIKGHDFVSPDHIIKNETVIKRYQRIVDEFNEELDQVQKVKKFILLADEWSVETGVLSPTLKLKRKRLNEKYQTLIDGFYD